MSASHITRAPHPLAGSVPNGYGLALLGCGLMGVAIVPSRGAYSGLAVAAVVLGLLVLLVLYAEQFGTPLSAGSRPEAPLTLMRLVWVGAFGLAWLAWNDSGLLVYQVRSWSAGRTAQAAGLLLLLTYLPALVSTRLREPTGWRWARFGLFACLMVVAGLAALSSSPHPQIDVWDLQQAGADSLLHGHNPFAEVAVADTGPRAGAGAGAIPLSARPALPHCSELPRHR